VKRNWKLHLISLCLDGQKTCTWNKKVLALTNTFYFGRFYFLSLGLLCPSRYLVLFLFLNSLLLSFQLPFFTFSIVYSSFHSSFSLFQSFGFHSTPIFSQNTSVQVPFLWGIVCVCVCVCRGLGCTQCFSLCVYAFAVPCREEEAEASFYLSLHSNASYTVPVKCWE